MLLLDLTLDQSKVESTEEFKRYKIISKRRIRFEESAFGKPKYYRRPRMSTNMTSTVYTLHICSNIVISKRCQSAWHNYLQSTIYYTTRAHQSTIYIQYTRGGISMMNQRRLSAWCSSQQLIMTLCCTQLITIHP